MAAPKNNRFAFGSTTSGRPPIYETPEQMMLKAAEYFDYETTASGICKPTISGLIFHLGFSCRQSWYTYKTKPEFKETVDRLLLFIESCYEKNLHGFQWAGSAFALRNINSEYWKDEIIQQQNQIITTVTPNIVQSGTPLAKAED